MAGAAPASSRYWLNRALFDLGERANREAFGTDRHAYFAEYPLNDAARAALIDPGWNALLAHGALPNLVFKYFMLNGLAPETFAAVAKEDGDG